MERDRDTEREKDIERGSDLVVGCVRFGTEVLQLRSRELHTEKEKRYLTWNRKKSREKTRKREGERISNV